MRTRVVCLMMLSLLLASCAESVHQYERMGLGSGYSSMSVEVPGSPGATGFVRSAYARAEAPASADLQLTQGQAVSLSGIVLKAKRLDGMTEVEVLQLPLEADGRPTGDRRQSQGRFLARQTTFLDPAILATGPVVTVHGVVEGVVERPLEPGSDNYAYPIVVVQDLTIWPHELLQPYGGAYVQAIGQASPPNLEPETGWAFGFLGALFRGFGQALFMPNHYDSRHHYGYSSYAPNYSSGSSPSPNPPPPAQKDIPPQFRKHNH